MSVNVTFAPVVNVGISAALFPLSAFADIPALSAFPDFSLTEDDFSE